MLTQQTDEAAVTFRCRALREPRRNTRLMEEFENVLLPGFGLVVDVIVDRAKG